MANQKNPQRSPPGEPPAYERIQVEDHDQLMQTMTEIRKRINAHPNLSHLLLSNPLLLLEDLGIDLSVELREHVRRTLGFPKKRVSRIVAARKALRGQLRDLSPEGEAVALPKTPAARASLVFDTLGVAPRGERPKALTVEELEPYADDHPVVGSMLRLGRMERGIFQYNSRDVYEQHKAGLVHHGWLTSITLLGED